MFARSSEAIASPWARASATDASAACSCNRALALRNPSCVCFSCAFVCKSSAASASEARAARDGDSGCSTAVAVDRDRDERSSPPTPSSLMASVVSATRRRSPTTASRSLCAAHFSLEARSSLFIAVTWACVFSCRRSMTLFSRPTSLSLRSGRRDTPGQCHGRRQRNGRQVKCAGLQSSGYNWATGRQCTTGEKAVAYLNSDRSRSSTISASFSPFCATNAVSAERSAALRDAT
jgi:hypothetical protein